MARRLEKYLFNATNPQEGIEKTNTTNTEALVIDESGTGGQEDEITSLKNHGQELNFISYNHFQTNSLL